MNEELNKAWAEADANPGKVIDIGNIVVCDVCCEDWTNSPVSGGFILGSYAYCPKCMALKPEAADARKAVRCPPYMSFADFCLAARGGDNTIRITKGKL